MFSIKNNVLFVISMIDYPHPREDLVRVPLILSKKMLTKINGYASTMVSICSSKCYSILQFIGEFQWRMTLHRTNFSCQWLFIGLCRISSTTILCTIQSYWKTNHSQSMDIFFISYTIISLSRWKKTSS
jgi:hypothetical protein